MTEATHTLAQRVALKTLEYYRAFSGLRPPSCRYLPTCSAYAAEAIETHGALRGFGLALRRVSRCHPLGGQGLDPVPAPAAATVPAPVSAPRPLREHPHA